MDSILKEMDLSLSLIKYKCSIKEKTESAKKEVSVKLELPTKDIF